MDQPVKRETVETHHLDGDSSFATVEVRRITMAAGVASGAHWHNGPVFGVIETGSVHVQIGTAPDRFLRTGDVFYEPAHQTITRFDATDEGVVFLGWFPTPAGVAAELMMGECEQR